MSSTRAPASNVSGPIGARPTADVAVPHPERPPTEEVFPVLAPPPPARVSAILAQRGPERPAAVFAVVLLAGYLALLGLTIALGLVLVHVILPLPGVSGADEELPAWLAAHRTDALDDASFIGSMIGDIPTLPLLVTVTAVLMAWRHRFRVSAFIVAAGLLELATYRVTSLLVHRDRPLVPKLDDLPAAQSYPSGHVAASIAVYAALALLLSSWLDRRWVTVVCWSLALVLPVIVAVSRLYRGMHHPTDEVAAVLVGVGALIAALVATRAYGEAVRRQARRRTGSQTIGARE